MSKRSVHHAAFTVEQTYAAAPAAVFRALSDAEIKRRWFGDAPGWEESSYALDFRTGGSEFNSARQPGGPAHIYNCRFFDIVQDERIVSAYEMHLDDKRISVSLATIELKPDGTGTKLVYTEQGAFLDGHDQPELRESGMRWLLGELGKELDRMAAAA